MIKKRALRGAPRGNQNASKGGISGRGRTVCDFGDMKEAIQMAATRRNLSLIGWIREAAEEKLAREGGKLAP